MSAAERCPCGTDMTYDECCGPLHRGEEKARLYELQLDRLSAFPVVPTPPLEDADFMRVKLQGSFVPGEHYLVDNQMVNGRPGYWVVQPYCCVMKGSSSGSLP